MRRLSRGAHVDVWPAFTDFLTSVAFLLVALLLATPWFFSVEALMPRGQEQEDPLKDIRRARAQIREVLQRQLRLRPDQIQEGHTEQRIILSDDQGALFDTGEARPKKVLRDRILGLGKALRPHLSLLARIEVEGHTDSVPFRAGTRTNWELSAERAVAVVKLLEKAIPPFKLSAKGYAKYHPAGVSDFTPERTKKREFAYIARANADAARKARNRRIEILIVYSEPTAAGAQR